MNCDLETFEYGRAHDRATYVVVERRLREDYEQAGERRIAFFMRSASIVATVTARRLRGQKTFLFYEVSTGGRLSYAPARKRVS